MYIKEAFESEMSMDVKAPIGTTSQRYVFLKVNEIIGIVKSKILATNKTLNFIRQTINCSNVK